MATATINPIPGYLGAVGAKNSDHSAQCYVHTAPPIKDVGYVTNESKFAVFLWNGSDADTVLTGITGDDQAEGIGWDASPPVAVHAQESLRVIVTVTIDGPLAFTASLTMAAACMTQVLQVVGTRAPHLSGDVGYLFMPHNWENGLDESLAWKTDVLIAHDRTEQRIQLRTHPRRAWDFRYLLSGAARRKFETWIGMRKTRYLFSPVWRDEARLAAPLAAGASVVYLDGPQLLDFAVGRWIAIYDAWDHFEIRAVTGIGAAFVAVDAPFEQDWPAGSLLAPCRYGLGLEQRQVTRFTEEVGDYRIRFEALNESVMPAFDPELYRSMPLCPAIPSWVDPEESWNNKWVRLDNDTGLIEHDIQSIEPVLCREAKFLLIGRPAIDLMLRFLFYCSGRLAPFWIAANERGIELAVPTLADSNKLIIEPIDYDFALSGSPARSHIELITTGGTVIRRMIIGVETLPTGFEQLTLDAALPVNISKTTLNRCAWLELCRLDSDTVDLHWVTGECVELTLPLVVLP